ncbi:protein phosphatase [Clostridium acetobutylicum]|uniref:PP2C phosphatase family n=1 Tax=Clostridium acetobutylicum (strain ATCC 824 / DSM 792 / JCM 1419 / IAM 19013 / LMG 5710 / NBRC 13948 / NRRL B-527 / VKM B-1787 / 2291 / W) TaxID=272562 RepID=Q97LZ3_CLOAB|nr:MULTISPECIES: PP2C family serine/threonine-protein phosphatase [Clostridium]AAK78387.1 PP2C phosphatase family [Clostridium acetobutylicum ATCC 824]ADZ19456.1 PP2C phosphatase family [Clostridium acetobutylicum EA 2018]AEI31224.1 PP2C phosphatase family protein [Clostridium acetobutylicum DSM 1731]AWV80110.1 serine/threonine-protein phosphatase [Clostridium acetobutylicum]MBC2392289.1 serine/threonine-protein phosphatase [Clostridium acetobutylicum]
MNKFVLMAGALSDKGNFKKTNEDNILVKIGEDKNGDFGIFVVCDGLGGLSSGEVASNMAVMRLKRWWEEDLKGLIKQKREDQIVPILSKILREINESIIQYGMLNGKRLGTTISLIFMYKSMYYILHVGDSRIYSIKNKIVKLTEDHSYVAYKVKNKMMTPEEARVSPERHVLLQCLGVKDEIDIFTTRGELSNNEIFMICSDGFYNELKEEDILTHIKGNMDFDNDALQYSAGKLVNIVKGRGESDNISVILVGIKKL